MKKINKKGFILAEAIVVAVFVLGIFTYLAVNIIPLITQYENSLKYDNPQEVYAANVLADEMNTDFFTYDNNILNYYDSHFSSYSVSFSCFDQKRIENPEFKEYYTELKNQLGIASISYNEYANSFLDGCTFLSKRSEQEYCNYLHSKGNLVNGSHVAYLSYLPPFPYSYAPYFKSQHDNFVLRTVVVQFKNGNFSNFTAMIRGIV